MDTTSISKLQFYSIGTVAANKQLGSKKIEVVPIESLPMTDGELTDNKSNYSVKTQDAGGSHSSVQLDTTVTIEAVWLPMGQTNRKTAPDVRRGETVVIYRFADTDKYWWVDMLTDSKIRRLETVVYAWSNNSKEGIEDAADSTYYFEVSTHNKIVGFHTSKNDGEPLAWDIQINAKEGKVVVTDDVGNYFVIDGSNRRLTMQNADGSSVDVNKSAIKIVAPDSVDIQTKRFNVVAPDGTSIQSNTTKIDGKSEVTGTSKLTGRVALDAGFDATNGSGGMSVLNGTLELTGNLKGTTADFSGNVTSPSIH